MPPASSSSFIPKRNPGAKPKHAPVKSVFVLSVISYSLFIAAPLASVGVFIYQLQAGKNSAEALTELNQAINSFNESDYFRVLEFNDRLNATKALNDSHVSVASTLDIIAKATADTVQFKTLNLNRTDTDTLSIKAELETSAFDGALFQRGQYDAQDLIADTSFTAVKFDTLEGSTAVVQSSNQQANTKVVNLNAEFTFAAADIAYTPLSAFTTAVPAVTAPVSETEVTPSDVANETDI
jgi:hypothetical protein